MGHRPHFLVIGAQKCGTSSLYLYLRKHARIYVDPLKELHYFDREDDYPDHDWYRARFDAARQDQVAGEITPIYCFWPGAVERIWEYDPQLQLVMLLRNPIDRAVSHYWMSQMNECETLPIEDALAAEPERLSSGSSFALRHHSYLARGRYVEQLDTVTRFFPRQQLLLLRTADLDREPAATMRRITDFFGLAALDASAYGFHRRMRVGKYEPISDEVRARLRASFAPFNERLTAEYHIRTDDWT